MSIENILSKIDEDSRVAVAAALERAGEEAAALSARYARRAGELETGLRSRADKKAAEEKRRLLVSEQLELRKADLVRKREILSSLYDEARKSIAALAGEDYLALIRVLVISRAISGAEEIVPAAGQTALLSSDFLTKLNSEYPGGGKFKIAAKEGTFGWGVVLREGRRTVDLSLGTVFDQVMDRIEPEVSAILFQPALSGAFTGGWSMYTSATPFLVTTDMDMDSPQLASAASVCSASSMISFTSAPHVGMSSITPATEPLGR